MPRRHRPPSLAAVSHFEVDSAFLLVKISDFCALLPSATLLSVRRAYNGQRARDVVTALDALRLLAPDTRGRTPESLYAEGDDEYTRVLEYALSSSALALALVAPECRLRVGGGVCVDDWLDGGALERMVPLERSLLTRV